MASVRGRKGLGAPADGGSKSADRGPEYCRHPVRRCQVRSSGRIDSVSLRAAFASAFRLLRIDEDRVAIIAFLHGARDFARWRRSSGN